MVLHENKVIVRIYAYITARNVGINHGISFGSLYYSRFYRLLRVHEASFSESWWLHRKGEEYASQVLNEHITTGE